MEPHTDFKRYMWDIVCGQRGQKQLSPVDRLSTKLRSVQAMS